MIGFEQHRAGYELGIQSSGEAGADDDAWALTVQARADRSPRILLANASKCDLQSGRRRNELLKRNCLLLDRESDEKGKRQ